MSALPTSPQASDTGSPINNRVATKNLLKLRRDSAAQLYFELGPQRSVAKVLPVFHARYGAVSLRTLAQWSTDDKWVDRALAHDREHAAAAGREQGLRDFAKLDLAGAIDCAIKKYMGLAVGADIVIRNEQGLRAIVQVIGDLVKIRESLPEKDFDREAPRASDDRVTGPSAAEILNGLEQELRRRAERKPTDEADLSYELVNLELAGPVGLHNGSATVH